MNLPKILFDNAIDRRKTDFDVLIEELLAGIPEEGRVTREALVDLIRCSFASGVLAEIKANPDIGERAKTLCQLQAPVPESSKPYAIAMEEIEALFRKMDVERLRQDVIFAESQIGKHRLPNLPSGRTVDQHTARARLFLDFIDELRAQETAEKEVA